MNMFLPVPSQAIYKACLLPGCQPVPGDLDEVGPFMTGSLLVYREYMLVQVRPVMQTEVQISYMNNYICNRICGEHTGNLSRIAFATYLDDIIVMIKLCFLFHYTCSVSSTGSAWMLFFIFP